MSGYQAQAAAAANWPSGRRPTTVPHRHKQWPRKESSAATTTPPATMSVGSTIGRPRYLASSQRSGGRSERAPVLRPLNLKARKSSLLAAFLGPTSRFISQQPGLLGRGQDWPMEGARIGRIPTRNPQKQEKKHKFLKNHQENTIIRTGRDFCPWSSQLQVLACIPWRRWLA